MSSNQTQNKTMTLFSWNLQTREMLKPSTWYLSSQNMYYDVEKLGKHTLQLTVQRRWFFIKIPPRTGGVDFLAHRGSSWYPTPIPTATDFSSTAFPPSSLRKTTHLPVELRGGQKFILASAQWKISDVRMIDISEFAWGGNRNLYFAYASFGWLAAE